MSGSLVIMADLNDSMMPGLELMNLQMQRWEFLTVMAGQPR
jgi:hypothetical protein